MKLKIFFCDKTHPKKSQFNSHELASSLKLCVYAVMRYMMIYEETKGNKLALAIQLHIFSLSVAACCEELRKSIIIFMTDCLHCPSIMATISFLYNIMRIQSAL